MIKGINISKALGTSGTQQLFMNASCFSYSTVKSKNVNEILNEKHSPSHFYFKFTILPTLNSKHKFNEKQQNINIDMTLQRKKNYQNHFQNSKTAVLTAVFLLEDYNVN